MTKRLSGWFRHDTEYGARTAAILYSIAGKYVARFAPGWRGFCDMNIIYLVV